MKLTFQIVLVILFQHLSYLYFRAIHDNDDEVRDRATFSYHMLSSLDDAAKLVVPTLGTFFFLFLFFFFH